MPRPSQVAPGLGPGPCRALQECHLLSPRLLGSDLPAGRFPLAIVSAKPAGSLYVHAAVFMTRGCCFDEEHARTFRAHAKGASREQT